MFSCCLIHLLVEYNFWIIFTSSCCHLVIRSYIGKAYDFCCYKENLDLDSMLNQWSGVELTHKQRSTLFCSVHTIASLTHMWTINVLILWDSCTLKKIFLFTFISKMFLTVDLPHIFNVFYNFSWDAFFLQDFLSLSPHFKTLYNNGLSLKTCL